MGLDYRPDWQPNVPGILTTARNVVPDKYGNYFTSYAGASSGYTGAIIGAGSVVGARMVKTPTLSRLVVGTFATLKEADGAGGWTDRSGAAYGLVTGQRWWFEQFGDETTAWSLGHATQTSTTGAFSNLSNAPKALVAFVLSGHLCAANYNDGSASPSGIKWASQGSSTTWTPTSSNTAGNAILRESPGAITAAATIHDIAVVWKNRSMYIGKRVGGAGTDIIRFNLLSPKIGCVGQEAWAATPVGIIFVSENGIYRFDGSVPQPIDEGIRIDTYSSYITPGTIEVSHDESRGCVFFWIKGATKCYAYNYLSQKWSIAYSSTANLGNATYAAFVTHVRDANAVDALALNVSIGAATRTAHHIVSTGQVLANLSNTTIANAFISSLESGLLRGQGLGADEESTIDRVVVEWATELSAAVEPSSGTMTLTPYSRPSGASAAALTTSSASLDSDKRFDARATGKVIKATFTFTNEYFGIADIGYKMKKAGTR
jgi:hypothetical protein